MNTFIKVRKPQTFRTVANNCIALLDDSKNLDDLMQKGMKMQACTENEFDNKLGREEVQNNMWDAEAHGFLTSMNKKRIVLLLNRAKPALQNAFAMIGRAASQDFLPKILIIREGSSSKNQSIMFTVEGATTFHLKHCKFFNVWG